MGEIINKTRGGSGALIELWDKKRVRKTGTTRVGDEGRWLKLNRSPGLVQVEDVWETGYLMEMLTQHPGFRHVFDYVIVAASTLALDIWWRPAEILTLDTAAHRLRLQPLLPHIGEHALQFTQMYYSIPWQNLILCRTHGDPIMDNIMRRGDENVLIDPIPATPAIPDYLAVDVGRIIQSAVGYERARYGVGPEATEHPNQLIEAVYQTTNRRVTRYEVLACYYFATFHLLRACADRRATPKIQEALYPLIARVMKEASAWMSSSLPVDVAVA